MSDPNVVVFLMTKSSPGREELAMRTVRALETYLHYDGILSWYIADQSDDLSHAYRLRKTLDNRLLGWHSEKYVTPGKSWNEAIMRIFASAPIYLRMEDDFELTQPLDITPYVRTLMEKENVGMIRLGLMPIQLDLHSVSNGTEIFFRVEKSKPYAYSGNPGLIHKRFHEAYGWFDEHANPGEIEVRLDHNFRQKEGPQIWWPLLNGRFGTYGAFHHIGEVKSYG